MLLLSGTLPMTGDEVALGKVSYDSSGLRVGSMEVPRKMLSIGAAALMGSASKTAEALGMEPPMAVVAGDMGDGSGSRRVYKFLIEEGGRTGATTVTLHYILPLRQEFVDFVEMADYWEKRPFLIADAGAILIAKATGLCERFDLFTPDAGELAFLADQDAGHPAYVKASLFEVDTTQVPSLIAQAYGSHNSPRYMLVKGPVDYVVDGGKVLHQVDAPNIPVMEAIGGTGDTITGMVSVLISGGFEPVRASLIALRANRLAGLLCDPTPATRVFEIVDRLGEAIGKVIEEARDNTS